MAPADGEVMGVRLYLAPYETTPTYRNVHNKFSVSYMLNLVLVDEEDRRYFKQQEIVLYRCAEGVQAEAQSRGPPPSLAGGRGPSTSGAALAAAAAPGPASPPDAETAAPAEAD